MVSSLEQLNQMMNYKEIFEESRGRINNLKGEIKKEIVGEVKKLVREYYEKNLII